MEPLGRVWGFSSVWPITGRAGSAKPTTDVESEDHRPSGILSEVWWGALSVEGKKLDRCSKVIIGFPVSIPSALVKR